MYHHLWNFFFFVVVNYYNLKLMEFQLLKTCMQNVVQFEWNDVLPSFMKRVRLLLLLLFFLCLLCSFKWIIHRSVNKWSNTFFISYKKHVEIKKSCVEKLALTHTSEWTVVALNSTRYLYLRKILAMLTFNNTIQGLLKM